MRAHRRMFLAALAAFALVLPGTARADNSVAIEETTVNGSSVTVKGSALFPAITTPETVLTDNSVYNAGTLPPEVFDSVGLKLMDARIVPIEGGLRFIWVVSNMPPQVPPEGVRYNWSIDIGNKTYQLQAKRTNLSSVTTLEDLKGHAEQFVARKEFFQLRGACLPNYLSVGPQNVAGCYHFAFLNGSFDIANKQVTMDWPFETQDNIGRIVAPDFKPGVTVHAHDGSKSAGMSIAGSFQAVISNQPVSNWINDWSDYYVGGRVQLAVGDSSMLPEEIEPYGPAVTLTDGQFNTTLDGIGGATDTVFVRACNGHTCAFAQKQVI